MSIASPPVDSRTTPDVVSDTTRLVRGYSSWKPRQGGAPDAGSALIQVFAGMASQVISRLNQVPDRSFLAFLNLIGVEPQPPRAALAPLTFSLAASAKTAGLAVNVPEGTLVGVAGGASNVVFATTLDLEMTTSQLVSVFTRQPDGDFYSDDSATASGASATPYEVFVGASPMDHILYLAADEVLALPLGTGNNVIVSLDLASADVATWQDLCEGTATPVREWPYYQGLKINYPLVLWEYWNGVTWWPLDFIGSAESASWEMHFAIPGDIAAVTVNDQSARWIRGRLQAWPAEKVPAITGVTVTTGSAVVTAERAPDAAFCNGAPIDLSKDFYPFGQEPRFNDTFYVASSAALSRPGATVTFAVAPSSAYASSAAENNPPAENNPTLAWEVWTGSVWLRVGQGDMGGATQGTGFSDDTHAFTTEATVIEGVTIPLPVTLPVPSQPLPLLTYQGVKSVWLRVRLVAGDYGKGPYLTDDSPPVVSNASPYTPPILQAVSFSACYQPVVTPTCLAYNDLGFVDATSSPSFVPFALSGDTHPALYIGFDRAFGNRSTVLYLQVAPLSLAGPTRDDLKGLAATPPAPAVVAWEYFRITDPTGTTGTWAPLGADDGTRAFAESGLLQFIGPTDFAPKVELGKSLWWLRARLQSGGYSVPPRAGRVLTNTLFAAAATTISNEVLGSASAAPSQTFTLTQTPVLAGQQIEVMEPQMPAADSLAALEAEEGTDAVTVIAAQNGAPQQIWVRWHAVPSFVLSGPGDRHYQIDSASGTVRFGNGRRGMVPPAGNSNVRAAWYQSGGGAQGNVAAGTITQLKTAVAYVGGVTNTEPSSGGADAESLDQVRDRGPTVLRHRGRAVAAEDFVDLAREASPSVARVCAISPWFDPTDGNPADVQGAGRVLLVLVPAGSDPRPTPGLGLLEDVGAYLRARAAPAVNLVLSGPSWIAVSVTYLSIVPVSLEGADALATTVDQALTRFFHPLTGGFTGQGWQLGQLPHTSDVFRLVEAIDGVDAVLTLRLTFESSVEGVSIDETTANNDLAGTLVCSGTHTIRIVPPASGG